MPERALADIGPRKIALAAYAALIIALGTYHRWLWMHNNPLSKVVLVITIIVVVPTFIYLDGGDDA